MDSANVEVLAAGSLLFAIGLGASISFDLAFPVETLFNAGAASALASVSARVRFDRAMTIHDAIRKEDATCKIWRVMFAKSAKRVALERHNVTRDRLLARSLYAENKCIVLSCSIE